MAVFFLDMKPNTRLTVTHPVLTRLLDVGVSHELRGYNIYPEPRNVDMRTPGGTVRNISPQSARSSLCCHTLHTSSMAKSSKKQCRAPKPARQGGGLVVISQRNLQSKPTSQRPPQANKGKATKGQKKNKGLAFGDLIAAGDGDESDDFDAPPPSRRAPVVGASGVAEYMFASTHTSREQRLYYLLATRPAAAASAAGASSGDAVAAASTAAVEGGCHALVFVETTAVAQGLIGELKALSLVAFAIHERTPKAQVIISMTFKYVNTCRHAGCRLSPVTWVPIRTVRRDRRCEI